MSHINLLIKPASGNCNLRCKYCFYHDITEKREVSSFGFMTRSTLESIIKRVCEEHPRGECTVAFQGGEPTLAGLDFFEDYLSYQKKYKPDTLTFHHAIQTNGTLIDEKWASFLAANHFLVGLSLDGHQDLHDLWRVDQHQNGTFASVLACAKLFDRFQVEYNILTVVTAQVAKNIHKVYAFFKKNNLRYQQYIPCLDPIGQERGTHKYSLTPKLYGNFLCALFDLWFTDVQKGEFAYNRYFENLVGMLLGKPPESCGLIGYCSNQIVVEADGSVYPCDFYVLDDYLIGNLATDSFAAIEQNRNTSGFVQQSIAADPACKSCQWSALCRGGCRRDREPLSGDQMSLNYFCDAYKQFFAYAYPRLRTLADRYRTGHA